MRVCERRRKEEEEEKLYLNSSIKTDVFVLEV